MDTFNVSSTEVLQGRVENDSMQLSFIVNVDFNRTVDRCVNKLHTGYVNVLMQCEMGRC